MASCEDGAGLKIQNRNRPLCPTGSFSATPTARISGACLLEECCQLSWAAPFQPSATSLAEFLMISAVCEGLQGPLECCSDAQVKPSLHCKTSMRCTLKPKQKHMSKAGNEAWVSTWI